MKSLLLIHYGSKSAPALRHLDVRFPHYRHKKAVPTKIYETEATRAKRLGKLWMTTQKDSPVLL